ncbi:hypothetical protein E2C01_048827 [Portunus trituberculatus]|uniref:Uncharacterized protein n=1 Tax=Portunus trituberculatus TaxID=210409 RepID=A0A5B7GCK8_PORTR|nr:hypothetical protein [Portunus trituberculatus]
MCQDLPEEHQSVSPGVRRLSEAEHMTIKPDSFSVTESLRCQMAQHFTLFISRRVVSFNTFVLQEPTCEKCTCVLLDVPSAPAREIRLVLIHTSGINSET